MIKLDNMFDFDEVECVMIASGLEEAMIDDDVQDIEEDDEADECYDSTIPDMMSTFSLEEREADELNAAATHLLADGGIEDEIDNAMMDIDPDVEEIEEDDDDYEDDDDEYDWD